MRRSRLLLALAVAVIAAGGVVYVVQTTDHPVSIGIGGGAPGAFNRNDALDPGIRRAMFSPDGTRLAAVSAAGIGLAANGHVTPVTPAELGAVDAAWMPNSQSLLVAEGPETLERLAVYDLDGNVTGVAHLDPPFSAGAGYGMTVDSRGARAVVVSETRETIGGRRHLDLVLVDLPTGHVSLLTATPDADESAPQFVDDDHVWFARTTAAGTRVVAIALDNRAENEVSPAGERGSPVGLVRGGAGVYVGGREGKRQTVWAVVPGHERQRMGTIPSDATLWTVEPGGTRGVATVITTTPDGKRSALLRAITLTPPNAA